MFFTVKKSSVSFDLPFIFISFSFLTTKALVFSTWSFPLSPFLVLSVTGTFNFVNSLPGFVLLLYHRPTSRLAKRVRSRVLSHRSANRVVKLYRLQIRPARRAPTDWCKYYETIYSPFRERGARFLLTRLLCRGRYKKKLACASMSRHEQFRSRDFGHNRK